MNYKLKDFTIQAQKYYTSESTSYGAKTLESSSKALTMYRFSSL